MCSYIFLRDRIYGRKEHFLGRGAERKKNAPFSSATWFSYTCLFWTWGSKVRYLICGRSWRRKKSARAKHWNWSSVFVHILRDLSYIFDINKEWLRIVSFFFWWLFCYYCYFFTQLLSAGSSHWLPCSSCVRYLPVRLSFRFRDFGILFWFSSASIPTFASAAEYGVSFCWYFCSYFCLIFCSRITLLLCFVLFSLLFGFLFLCFCLVCTFASVPVSAVSPIMMHQSLALVCSSSTSCFACGPVFSYSFAY